MMATAAAVAFILFSCKGKLGEADVLDLSSVPLQTIDNMFAVQTENGVVLMRMEADRMERYENDSLSRETFPRGVAMYSYSEDDLLETTIYSDEYIDSFLEKAMIDDYTLYYTLVDAN